MIFRIKRSVLGQENCQCSRIVILTGVTVTDGAGNKLLTWLILKKYEMQSIDIVSSSRVARLGLKLLEAQRV